MFNESRIHNVAVQIPASPDNDATPGLATKKFVLVRAEPLGPQSCQISEESQLQRLLSVLNALLTYNPFIFHI